MEPEKASAVSITHNSLEGRRKMKGGEDEGLRPKRLETGGELC